MIAADGGMLERSYTLYIGPKKLSLIRRFAPQSAEIMQFGSFRWLCVLLVPTLNFFYKLIPNYGIAIILLTILVRMLFWPLTRKSNESMKRMQVLQPKLKEIQASSRRSAEVQQDHGALPRAQGQPDVELPADADPDSVFIALFTVLAARSSCASRPSSGLRISASPRTSSRG